MIAKPLILPKKLLIGMAGVSIAMIIGLFYNTYQQVPFNMTWFYLAIVLLFVPFLAVLMDLIQNPIQGKLTWILFLTLTTIIATFFYLVMRDKVLEKSGLKEPEI